MSVVHPEDQAAIKAALKHSLVSNAHFDEGYRVTWPDKSIHWIHAIGGIIQDGDGNPSHMAGVLYEVTERKQLRLLDRPPRQESA